MENAMGQELSPGQAKLVEAYQTLAVTLRDQGEDLAPFEKRNAIKAMAALWQVLNGLDLDPPQIYDLGG